MLTTLNPTDSHTHTHNLEQVYTKLNFLITSDIKFDTTFYVSNVNARENTTSTFKPSLVSQSVITISTAVCSVASQRPCDTHTPPADLSLLPSRLHCRSFISHFGHHKSACLGKPSTACSANTCTTATAFRLWDSNCCSDDCLWIYLLQNSWTNILR